MFYLYSCSGQSQYLPSPHLNVAPLGWHNGKLTLKNYINSLDICFIQEHWLFDDSLNLVREIDPDFISVGVSGMNCDFICRGRPFGGCSILC